MALPNYIRIDIAILQRTDLSDKAKMLLGLIQSFDSQGLMMANNDIGELLCIHPKNVGRILREIKKEIQIKNPQSRYRKIFYCRKNEEVEAILLPQKRGSVKNSTTAFEHPTTAFENPTSSKTRTITKKNLKELIFSVQSPEVQISELLLSLILQRKPDFKKPNIQKWAKHVDLMIRIDRRSPETIRRVIVWAQSDSFWQANILSTATLREKFDRLEMKMNSAPKKRPPDFDPDPISPRTTEEIVV